MKVFITSDYHEDSPIVVWAKNNNVELHCQSLVEFSPTRFELPDYFDIIVFYSKNAVRYFAQGLQLHELQIVSKCDFVCIGQSTADEAAKIFGKTTKYNFEDYKDNTDTLNITLKGKTCLIPQARNSRKTIEKVLTECVLIPLVVYENTILDGFIPPADLDVVVVTSPMNSAAFFEANDGLIPEVISIGTTTSIFSEQNFGIHSHIATEPTENGILATLIKIRDKTM